jgi:hypothetical protein
MFQSIPTARTNDKAVGRAHDMGRTKLQQPLSGEPIESNVSSPAKFNNVRHAQQSPRLQWRLKL